uniref:Uncharacterized protein n=1 Tax=Fagus sylvatica TaxID=28930 RepID=A0A2N9J2H4_FAGSY
MSLVRFFAKQRPGQSMKLLPMPLIAAILPPRPPPPPSPFRSPPSPFRPPALAGPLPSRLFFGRHGHTWTWVEIKSAMKEKMQKAVGILLPILKIAVISFVQAFMAAMAVEMHTRLMVSFLVIRNRQIRNRQRKGKKGRGMIT